mmetsp:Transcript_92694/g.258181  ORF Transcript_92694/g.258181 Transcript_92694/m.258181 type:complete len:873 (-) Transcript_92694:242-2860(-)
MAAKDEKEEEETKKLEEDVEVKDEGKAEEEVVKDELEEEAADGEKPKDSEKPTELEADDAGDPRPKIDATTISFNAADTTLNVMPVANGKLLMTLTEGGFQYLLANARANVGLKAGRYMFEVKIVESLNPTETQGGSGRAPQPRQLVRVGVSLAGSSLFLTDGTDNVCFDSEGYFSHEKRRKKVAQKFSHDQTVAVLLNLDEKSANANTISLFRNGARISEPQALPENMRGKVLYPTVTYKNVTLKVNFGPAPLAKLPFQCRMVAEAAVDDVEVHEEPKPKDGKFEVLFPVGLPEQGFFDWVDEFVEKNPGFTELSDRKIVEWATKSGIWRPKSQGVTGSNDKVDIKFGIPMLDDMSVRRVLAAVAPTQRRSYIVPELRANLIADERKEALARFGAPEFTRSATVIMGEPSEEYKKRVQALLLADKQGKADAEKKRRAQEEERKRLLEEKRKKAEEARKAKEAAQKKKEGKEVAETKEEAPKDEKKEDSKMDEDVPVELSEEEKVMWYRKLDAPDLSERTLAKSFASFSLPTKKEGFNEISFAWQSEDSCTSLLKEWIFQKKLVQRVEDLQPGTWFKEGWSKWQKTLQEWRKRQSDYKDPVKRKALIAKKKEEAKKKAKEEKGEGGEDKEEEAKPLEINAEDIDVMSVEDVTDIGNGEPLFAHFVYEDWALLSARYEMHLLLHGFKKDLNDPDRPGFGEAHLAFYYNKYFKKAFSLKHFGTEKLADFVELIKETVSIEDKNSFLVSELPDDAAPADFVKVTEDHRRERQRRIDAGDETAKLKFSRPAPQPPTKQPQHSTYSSSRGPPSQHSRYGSGGSSRPGYNGGSSSNPPSYSSQKRSYNPPASSYGASKQPRTSSYSSSYGSGSSYYRR